METVERRSKEEWFEEVTENLDYYLNTEEGKKKLMEEAKKMAEQALEEVAKLHKPQREIIWLSKYCSKCIYFRQQASRMRCERWNARIVKPFYGKPLWFISRDEEGNRTIDVTDVDWDKKWIAVSEIIVEQAIEHINDGNPYDCYEPGRHR
ncbi:MAG: hypothetical protein QXG05_01420 [Nitrososphaerota archaeon]